MSTPPPHPQQAAGPPLPLADRVPGAVSHDLYAQERAALTEGLPPLAPPPPSRPSAWNAPAFGMLAIVLVALTALLWPQARARIAERKINPIVAALAQRDATARCPRYITSIFTNVGSVSLDANGRPSDRTDLTGPICDGLRRLLSPEGRAEMRCLVTDGRCSETAVRSVVALSVLTHEAMHLQGILDEGAAECASIAAGQRSGQLAGLSADEGRMVAWVHYAALNPNTPDEYGVSTENCAAVGDLERDPPGTEASRTLATTLAEETWLTLGDG